MAGDWIKMRSNLDTDPRVIGLAAELNTNELHVVGMLWKVWSWADAHSLDGNALAVTDVTLDRFTDCPGFAAALRKVGWLEGRNRALTFPRFSEHNGQTAKNRALCKDRVAKSRNAAPATNVTQEALPEKRREEKSIEEDANASSCPETPSASTGPPVLEFPCDGKPVAWGLTQSKLDEYQSSFPSLDVMAECRKARQWILDNPTERKTARGMTRFLGGWLGRAQNHKKAGTNGSNGKAVVSQNRVPTDADLENWSPHG